MVASLIPSKLKLFANIANVGFVIYVIFYSVGLNMLLMVSK